MKGRSCSASFLQALGLRVPVDWDAGAVLRPPTAGAWGAQRSGPSHCIGRSRTTIFSYCTVCNWISILQWIVFTYFKIATCTSTGRLALRAGEARVPDVLGTTAARTGLSTPWPDSRFQAHTAPAQQWIQNSLGTCWNGCSPFMGVNAPHLAQGLLCMAGGLGQQLSQLRQQEVRPGGPSTVHPGPISTNDHIVLNP